MVYGDTTELANEKMCLSPWSKDVGIAGFNMKEKLRYGGFVRHSEGERGIVGLIGRNMDR